MHTEDVVREGLGTGLPAAGHQADPLLDRNTAASVFYDVSRISKTMKINKFWESEPK